MLCPHQILKASFFCHKFRVRFFQISSKYLTCTTLLDTSCRLDVAVSRSICVASPSRLACSSNVNWKRFQTPFSSVAAFPILQSSGGFFNFQCPSLKAHVYSHSRLHNLLSLRQCLFLFTNAKLNLTNNEAILLFKQKIIQELIWNFAELHQCSNTPI